eukprot:scaffold319722_cov33-Prasinocladus_malaysianus.AAC.3
MTSVLEAKERAGMIGPLRWPTDTPDVDHNLHTSEFPAWCIGSQPFDQAATRVLDIRQALPERVRLALSWRPQAGCRGEPGESSSA